MSYLPEPKYEHGAPARIGVLLVNLGTPDAPTASRLRPYLRQFLSDPRVVEIPRAIWWPILNGIILNTRPAKSARKYAKIWTTEGSPLRTHTATQAKLLKGYLGNVHGAQITVAYGMRYGNPSIADALAELKQQQCDRILMLPLYPQYAASSTASACDALFDALKQVRAVPALRIVRQYHDHPAYIAALAAKVRNYWMKSERGQMLVMSFHGVPRFALDKGDPYHCQCHKTARLLGEALGLTEQQYVVTFQSRFGRAKWLEPYTEPTVVKLGKQRVGRVDVVCPGFPADCLETLEEINVEVRAAFFAAGGQEFHYIPCLNDHWAQRFSATNAFASDWAQRFSATNAFASDWAQRFSATNAFASDWAQRFSATNAFASDWAQRFSATNAYAYDWAQNFNAPSAFVFRWVQRFSAANAFASDWALTLMPPRHWVLRWTQGTNARELSMRR